MDWVEREAVRRGSQTMELVERMGCGRAGSREREGRKGVMNMQGLREVKSGEGGRKVGRNRGKGVDVRCIWDVDVVLATVVVVVQWWKT